MWKESIRTFSTHQAEYVSCFYTSGTKFLETLKRGAVGDVGIAVKVQKMLHSEKF